MRLAVYMDETMVVGHASFQQYSSKTVRILFIFLPILEHAITSTTAAACYAADEVLCHADLTDNCVSTLVFMLVFVVNHLFIICSEALTKSSPLRMKLGEYELAASPLPWLVLAADEPPVASALCLRLMPRHELLRTKIVFTPVAD